MKNIFTLLALVFFTSIINAQDLSGVSICINPGHGGHDSDDRHIIETDYWESEGNLTKGLYLRDILENCGATIVMSRVTNFTEDDLPLSQISAIANNNNVDYFHSIHSNAYNGSANYPLLLYRGYDDDPVFPEAKVMSLLFWDELLTNSNLYWSYGYDNVRGDWDFYPWGTQGLGVLRNLTMPGVLSEGSFHDYYPESWRLQNLDYRKYEAWNLADAIVNYFGEPGFSTGLVTGVARDPYEITEYYWVPGSNDENIPINGYTATLLPDNISYQADEMNNGVFFFDSITPGSYQVVFEAEGYFNDTVDIAVLAGETTIVDRWLPFDTTIAPVIYSHYMPSLPDSVGSTESITLNFNTPMNTSTVETAFNINPPVIGEFTWENDDKTLVFSHTETFEKATEYTVTISTDAKSIWDVSLETDYSFDFISLNRNRLNLLDMFPKNNIKANTKLQFRLIFDAPLIHSSLIDNVVLYNENDEVLSTAGAQIFEDEGKGYYFFRAETELEENKNYKLVIYPEIYDTNGTPFFETLEINFLTKSEGIVSGTVIEDFESIGTWQDPDNSTYTQGTNPELTSFLLTPFFNISPYFSGKLAYNFSEDEGGICAATNTNTYNIGANNEKEFGMWVFGDLSYNLLEYWFYYDETTNAPVFIDTIDWAGWDLKYIPVSDIAGSGDRLLHSLVIKQNPDGNYKGKVYFDNIISDLLVPVKTINTEDFYLKQNYPNPFNNSTTFEYNLPVNADIKLEVFNILGQKVSSVKINNQKSGLHTLNWNGLDAENGTYIYKFVATTINSETFQKSGVLMKY